MHRKTTNAKATPTPGRSSRQPCGARGRGGRSNEQHLDGPRRGRKRPRPARRDIEGAALELIRRRGREILATARCYAANLDDAEDAYQRGLEILLEKAPTTREVDLVRWLKTGAPACSVGEVRRAAG